ncbi:MAG: right-handed parallel beta-helix repeat-containing protein [Bacteroidota bacterium]
MRRPTLPGFSRGLLALVTVAGAGGTVVTCGPSQLAPIRAIDASILQIDGSVADTAGDQAAPPDTGPADVPMAEGSVPEIPVELNCPTTLVGFANETPGTTGGVVTASTLAQLMTFAMDPNPLTIEIGTMIQVTGNAVQVRVQSNKTIRGTAAGAGLSGAGFYIKEVTNVLMQNLTIARALGTDAIGVDNSSNVWIDHCDLSSDMTMMKGTYDGLIDIAHGSRSITVSWNLFHDHFNPTLVGGSNATGVEDANLAVTYHHNRFLRTGNNHPRVRFGRVHVFNNLYQEISGNAIASVMGARVKVERNVFEGVKSPMVTTYEMDPESGFINEDDNLYDSGSLFDRSTLVLTAWTPDYRYTPDPVSMVRALVIHCAGANL